MVEWKTRGTKDSVPSGVRVRIPLRVQMPRWRNGLRGRLRPGCPYGLEGSNPFLGTTWPRGGMEDTTDLKSVAHGRPGSNPGGATVDSI